MPSKDDARAALRRLIHLYDALSQERREALSEADVVTLYVEPLLTDVLGWPKDANHFFKELHIGTGRPDITLHAEGQKPIFVEAKAFDVIREMQETRSKARAVLMPEETDPSGVAYTRSKEEQQAVNYAYQAGGEWAILTNFQRFRLFNARQDRLVLAVEDPALLLADDVFNLLWLLAYPSVLHNSLDQLRTVHHAPEVDTKYLQFISEWREKLAQDLLERPAANPWLFRPDGSPNLPALREVVQRYLDRLVLVRFAEDHLVIRAGTLWSYYENRRSDPYTFTLDQFIDRLMRAFNDQHNSSLFAPHLADTANFSDDALMQLIPRLYDARYRAMPADILGNTYEQYLGKRLAIEGGRVVTRDNLETRKKQGSYYTPQVIVRHLVDTTLGRYLYGTRNGQPDGEPVPGETRKTADDIQNLRVLDAACGSGSFLIYAYQVLARYYESETMRLKAEIEARNRDLEAQGYIGTFRREQVMPLEDALHRLRDYPRLILETHLYGVDLDPQAAEIAVVNLLMRAMERPAAPDQRRLPLLLNQNIKVGNGLIGLLPADPRLSEHRAAIAEIARLRAELRRTSHGPAHDAALTALAAASAALRDALNVHFTGAFDDLDRVRPFCWGVEFPEVFYDDAGEPLPEGGFTVILGNPPWEILKPDLREFYAQFDERIESKLTRPQAEARIAGLDAEDPARRAGYEAHSRLMERTSAFVRASPDYTRQGRGDLATHKLFTERMWRVLTDGGRLGYVVPSGIYTDLGTKDLRQMLLFDEGCLDYLYSFSNERYFFNGVDHRFKFCLLAARKGGNEETFEAAFRFNPRVAVAPDDFPAFISDPANRITVERESIRRFSPDSLSLMEFQNPRDYAVAEKIYADWPLLGEQVDGAWNVKFTREFDKTNDRALFNSEGRGLPVYEGENFGFYGDVLRPPSVWMDEELGRRKLLGSRDNSTPLDYEEYRFGFRRIARATDIRTLIVSYLPTESFALYTLTTTVQFCELNSEYKRYMSKAEEMFLYACMASYVLDYVMRFQVSSSVAMFNAYSLPVPRLTAGDPYFDAIVPRAARLTCTRPEFDGLWASVMGTASPPPPHRDGEGQGEGTRQRLRDEIDGLAAHLYGLARDEYAHILASFPLVFPDTDAGRARKAAALAAYDAAPALIAPPR